MTALNVIVSGAAAHVVTDSALFSPGGGRLAALGSKVSTIPHVGAVIGVSGPAGLVHILATLLQVDAEDVDQLVAAPIIAKLMTLKISGAVPGVLSELVAAGTVRIAIAGHSKRHGPAAWIFASDHFDRFGPGVCFMSPHVEGWSFTGDHDAPAFEAACVDLLNRQRAVGPVGGAVTLTSVRQDKVEQRILHRWGDRVGDRLGPTNNEDRP